MTRGDWPEQGADALVWPDVANQGNVNLVW